MGTISKLNDVLCVNISKVNDVLKANALKFDDNTFCPTPTPTQTPGGSPTPTPTITPTPTPTPTPSPQPCVKGCCFTQLCYGRDCSEACSCNNPVEVYLSLPCDTDPCTLAYAVGIFVDDLCTSRSADGYYSDGTDCYYWDGVSLSYSSPC